MKRSVLSAILLTPLLIHGQMNITAQERVSQILTPDVLQGNIGFEEENKNSSIIKEHLNALVAEIKKNDPESTMCRGGGYYLSPRYSYKDQKQEFIGYSGNLNIGCEFSSIEQYNALMKNIEKVKNPSVRTTQGALEWRLSAKVQERSRYELRSKLLQMAQTQAKAFSKETQMSCHVQSVTFEGSIQERPYMMKTMAMASAPTESPIQNNETSSLEATVNYLCSDSK